MVDAAKSGSENFAAKRLYRSQPVSGETEEEALHNIMKLYRSRNTRKDNTGVLRDGPVLKSLVAVCILRQCPKFYGCGATSQSDANYRSERREPQDYFHSGVPDMSLTSSKSVDQSGLHDGVNDTTQITSAASTRSRPIGIKKAKLK
eukprot:IDg13065t1